MCPCLILNETHAVSTQVVKEVQVEVPVKVPYEVERKIQVPITVTVIQEVPIETHTIETHEVEVIREVPRDVVREVTVHLKIREEVIKEVHLSKTILQDKLIVTKDRVEVPKPVTVIQEVPFYHERIVEVCVKEVRVQEKMVEMVKQVAVELIRQVSMNVPKIVEIKEQVTVEKQVHVEVPVTITTERIRNVEVIKEVCKLALVLVFVITRRASPRSSIVTIAIANTRIHLKQVPVEMVREVPLMTTKEKLKEVEKKEIIEMEKLVELHTTEEKIRTVHIVKEEHHDHVIEVPVIVEVERPENARLMRDLIRQVSELNDYIDKLQLSSRSTSQRLNSQIKGLERVMSSERAVAENLRETIAHMHHQPILIREVIKEVCSL